MTQPFHGPGPIIGDPDINQPGHFIVQQLGHPQASLTQPEIAAIPLHHQWFTGTVNGLIASWPTREIAEQAAEQRGCLLGQIMPVTIAVLAGLEPERIVLVLTDADGTPLTGSMAIEP